jgi:hypothetical protein
MGCNGCANKAESDPSPVDSALEHFWPAVLPFPPMTPWLAAVVSRSEAREWALATGIEQRADVLSGDPTAMLDFIGRALLADGVFAEARKRKKKDRPTLPPGTGEACCSTARAECCAGAERCEFSCSPNADGSCITSCRSVGGGVDSPGFETAEP